jgi:hypothetical protein
MVLITLLSVRYYQINEIGLKWFQNGAVFRGMVWFTLIFLGLQLVFRGFGYLINEVKKI